MTATRPSKFRTADGCCCEACSLICHESLSDDDDEDQDEDLWRPTIIRPPSQKPKQFCAGCLRKNIDYRNKVTVYNPVRLEHAAIAATLRAFDDFEPSTLSKNAYQAFKNLARSVDARYYMISFDWFTYGQFSKIAEIIDRDWSKGRSPRANFSFAQPVCCCAVFNQCADDWPGCANYLKPRMSQWRFTPIRFGHRNNSSCCCNGLRTSACRKSFYVTQGLINK